MKKSTSIVLLTLILAFTALWTVSAFVPISIGRYDHIPFSDERAIKKGLDLNGGVYAVYQAKNADEADLATKMRSTIAVMRQRIDNAGYTEATISQQGTAQIRVEIPSVKDPDEVLKIIGTPAKLEFIDPDGTVIIDGSQVISAEAGTLEGMKSVVYFTLNDEGAKLFSEATSRLAATRSPISIVLDGNVISSPTVNTHIGGGEGYIEGDFTADSAKELAE
ncbi:MAG: protein translocase subunit SecD, partial [Eubacteriales bacterium]|nr:protein translocase subunit SecD [Eubacteriales bacterium]